MLLLQLEVEGFTQNFIVVINTTYITSIRKTSRGNAAIKLLDGTNEYYTVLPFEEIIKKLINN